MSGRSPGSVRRAHGHSRHILSAVAVVFSVAVATIAVLQARQGSTEPPYRDLMTAESQLAEVRTALTQATDSLMSARARLEDLKVEREGLLADEIEYAAAMQQQEEQARRLAIEAYMSGGGLTDAAYLLDSYTANQWVFRTGVLVESAEAVAQSSQAYLEMRAGASEEVIALADEMDDVARAIQLSLDDIARLERVISDAEYVVWIAQIHALADSANARYGRTEPTEEQWSNLRRCESTENYQVATGNGYWGAYQFDLSTWETVGGTGYPSSAPPEEQDARARLLYHRRGWQPWPICGRFLPQE